MTQFEHEEATFASMGKPFQEKLAFLIAEDLAFANQIGEVIDINFFELKYLRMFVKDIYDFRDKFKVYPSKATIENIIETKTGDDASIKQLKDFFKRSFSRNW
jgi:hypothetical protein